MVDFVAAHLIAAISILIVGLIYVSIGIVVAYIGFRNSKMTRMEIPYYYLLAVLMVIIFIICWPIILLLTILITKRVK